MRADDFMGLAAQGFAMNSLPVSHLVTMVIISWDIMICQVSTVRSSQAWITCPTRISIPVGTKSRDTRF